MSQASASRNVVQRGENRKDRKPPKHVNRCWYEFSRFVVRAAAAVFFRIRYSGSEAIPRTGPVLIVSNHQSHLDPPLIGAGVPRTTSYLARQSLFRSRLFSRLLRSYGAIPLDLEGNPLAGLRESLRRLKSGDALLIFPEGTRTPHGDLQPFERGFTALARRSQAAIVPAAIEGAFQAWPRRRRFPRPGRVRVHFGPPLMPDEYREWSDERLLAETEAR
ncbi:MAG: 1-acyl-sn-glycerol-3-phosphate acyltransferase, partial [Thermogutta sp.]|nr:1-acyl-sn-glycerol-3-phosphate acyltransferase [Thermogutta sp.]